jgi:hypothetical protein
MQQELVVKSEIKRRKTLMHDQLINIQREKPELY